MIRTSLIHTPVYFFYRHTHILMRDEFNFKTAQFHWIESSYIVCVRVNAERFTIPMRGSVRFGPVRSGAFSLVYWFTILTVQKLDHFFLRVLTHKCQIITLHFFQYIVLIHSSNSILNCQRHWISAFGAETHSSIFESLRIAWFFFYWNSFINFDFLENILIKKEKISSKWIVYWD